MNLITLCNRIQLQDEIQKEVIEYSQTSRFHEILPFIGGLKNMETESQTRKELEPLLGADPKKIKMLTCMLTCAVQQYQWYQEKGISETIYFDTMRCFTRFIEECRQITGQYAFDREWWAVRQISGILFRIGELEYEMVKEGLEPAISIHIPSDSVFTPQRCDRSLEKARAFFAKYFPEYDGKDYVCWSWLLAPELENLLPPDSNIIAFQHRFLIQELDYSDTEYIQWVFKTKNLPLENLPEDTALQKKMKQHLLNGGKLGNGQGVLLSPTVK